MSRSLTVAALALSLMPVAAAAQSRDPRVTAMAIAGAERTAIDNGGGTFAIGGAGLRLRLFRHVSLEGELTGGTGEATDSYPAGSGTRDRVWTPGIGTAFGLAFHTATSQRVGVNLTMGLAGRTIHEVDAFPGESLSRSTRSRGGPFIACSLPLRVTDRIVLAPEIRMLRTLADEDFSATTVGIRAGWMF
jgi:opacity protein-like surface antigen